MNRHFQDARYYLKRAGESVKLGVIESLAPSWRRVRRRVGRDRPPGRPPVKRFKSELSDLQESAEDGAKETVEKARDRVEELRKRRTA